MVALHWTLAGVACVMALLAFARARRLSQRLDRLRESYWDLRYEVSQLQARLEKLEPADKPAAPPPLPAGTAAFVPLSSLKR